MKLIEPEILHTCVRLKIELLKLRIIKTILILNLKKDHFFFLFFEYNIPSKGIFVVVKF